jgi:6,7-dimethyl-8-ribityllumazine synthase
MSDAMTVDIFNASHDGDGLRIGVVQARFNEPVCNGLRRACVDELIKLGVMEEDILVCTVAGALEIPYALQKMAISGEFDALVAIGAVIRGETYHFEVVSNESAAGVMRVSLDHDIAIANAILTTNTDEQALERVDVKGREAAQVAVEMANLAESLEKLAAPEASDEQL